ARSRRVDTRGFQSRTAWARCVGALEPGTRPFHAFAQGAAVRLNRRRSVPNAFAIAVDSGARAALGARLLPHAKFGRRRKPKLCAGFTAGACARFRANARTTTAGAAATVREP